MVNQQRKWESSNNCSDDEESNGNSRCYTPLDHPTLNRLRTKARKQAEVAHALKRKPAGRNKDQRKIKNIRSAEISREARGMYIKLVEDQIEAEEQKWRGVVWQMMEVSRQTIALQKKYEARLNAKKRVKKEMFADLLPVEVEGMDGIAVPEWNNEDVAVTEAECSGMGENWAVGVPSAPSVHTVPSVNEGRVRYRKRSKTVERRGDSPVGVFCTAMEEVRPIPPIHVAASIYACAV